MNKLISCPILSHLTRCSSKGIFSEILQNQFWNRFCTLNQNNMVSSNDNKNLSEYNMKSKQNSSPPEPPDPAECCEDGCANCVWLNYVSEVKFYYKNNAEKLQEAFDIIPSVEHREFVRFSLKELEAERTSST